MTAKTIDVHDMQAQLNELLALVEAGGEIIVMDGGKAVARLVPASASAPLSPRPFGLATGEFVVPDDFDEPMTLQPVERIAGLHLGAITITDE